MNPRLTLAAVIAALILVPLAWWSIAATGTTDATDTAASRPAAALADAASIRELRSTTTTDGAAQSATATRTRPGAWLITWSDGTDRVWPGDPDLIRAELRRLGPGAVAESATSIDPDDAATVIAWDTDSETTGTLRLGTQPLAGKVAASATTADGRAVTGEASVLLAERLRPSAVANWRDPRPLAPLEGPPTRITVIPADAPGYTLESTASGWAMTDPPARIRLDQQRAAAVAVALTNLRAESLAEPFAPDPTAGQAPAFILEVANSDGNALRLDVIGLEQAADPQLLLRVTSPTDERLAMLARVRPADLPQLPASGLGLADARPAPWPAGETARITLTRNGSTVTLARTIDGWRTDAGLDAEQAEQLAALLGQPAPLDLLPAERSATAAATLTIERIGGGAAVTHSIEPASESSAVLIEGDTARVVNIPDGLRGLLLGG